MAPDRSSVEEAGGLVLVGPRRGCLFDARSDTIDSGGRPATFPAATEAASGKGAPMQPSRLLVLVAFAAAALGLLRPHTAAASSVAWYGSGGAIASLAPSWDPWSLLRDWVGRFWIDAGCTRDPNGQCIPASSALPRTGEGCT